ncbi:MAG: CaiB/BaiF CoA transferase family protein [Terriglobales bacterium]
MDETLAHSREHVKTSGPGPLAGLVVVDMTRYLPGAVTTLWLARFGAEVIKVERPGAGDPGRMRPGAFAVTCGGKRSVALDLQDERGRDLLRRLTERADVLVENFRPGVLERLGLGYEQLGNPRLIYASLSGFPRQGSAAGAAGHDINYSAFSGLIALLGASGAKRLPELPLADVAGGSFPLLSGILLALLARTNTGRGQRVDVSIVAGLASLLAWPLAATAGRLPPPHGGNLLDGSFACYGVYAARGRGRLAVGALEPKFWANLCRKLGCEEMIADQFARGQRQEQMRRRLEAIFRTRTVPEWFGALRGRDCCVTPVRSLKSAYRVRPQQPLGVELGTAPERIDLPPAPRLGQHSAQVLAEIGVAPGELRTLAAAGVVQRDQTGYHKDA